MKTARLIAILLTLTTSLLAQEPEYEYGSPAELRGITKIYIYTHTDLESRNRIIKEIRKKLPDLIIVERGEDAEVTLTFASATGTRLAGVHSNRTDNPYGSQTTTTPNYEKVKAGSGMVSRQVGPNKVRLLMDFNDSKSTLLEKDPATNFAKAFIREYQKANKEEKKKK